MQKLISLIKIIAFSFIITIFMLIIIFAYNKQIPYELLLQEAIPFYRANNIIIFKPNKFNKTYYHAQTKKVFKNNLLDKNQDQALNTKKNKSRSKSQQENINLNQDLDLITEDNIEYQDNIINNDLDLNNNLLIANKNLPYDFNLLRDIDYLKNKFYISDKKTEITRDDFNIDKLLATNVSLNKKNKSGLDNNNNEPKVLIFHTHSTEMFKDSNPDNIYDGVVGLGKKLCDLLNQKYNINTLHHIKRYDIINNKPDKRGAYERMEPDIIKILAANPSIEVAIDIHRDGVAESVHLVENINNKPTAKIMFVNGLCKLLKNNILTPIDNLQNPYINTNLALSLKMQMQADKLYPKLNRKIYINAYRYSLNMLPKSLLIEVGAQTNTKQEVLNSIDPLAEILANVLLDLD